MFKCDKCGLCCKNLTGNALYADLDNGNGVCKYLTGNLCSIYETRPIKCNIEKFYEQYLKNVMSKQDYDNLNKNSCQQLKLKQNKGD